MKRRARSIISTVAAAGILSAGLMVVAPAEAAVTPVTNPTLAEKCGLSIALVLDASGSIQTSNAVTQVRSAASSLLNSLSGTGSYASVVQFGTVGRQEAGYTQVTAASLASTGALGQAVARYFNPQPPLAGRTVHIRGNGSTFNSTSSANWSNSTSVQYTNWEDALLKTRAVPGAPGGKPDLVVFLTDGDPTAVNVQPGNPAYPQFTPNPANHVLIDSTPGTEQQLYLDPAITAANALKSQGSKILAVGVGNGLSNAASQQRLKDVSGPNIVDLDEGEVLNIATDDVVVTTSFDRLAQATADIAVALCQSSLTITKLAQSAGSNEYVPAPDWDFTVTPTPSAGTFNWVLPAGATGPSALATTGADGKAAFQWKLSDASATTSLRVTETGKDPFTFSRASCEVRSSTGVITPIASDTLPIDVPGVRTTDIVTCEVRNSFDYDPEIALAKSADPTTIRTDLTPATVEYAYTATNEGNTPLSNVLLSDDKCAPIGAPTGDTNADGRLDLNETWTYTCTADVSGMTETSLTNHATIAGTDPNGTTVSDTDEATVTLQNPSLEVVKSANPAGPVAPGTSVTYSYLVTNTGNVDLTNVTVTDDRCPSVTPASADLAVGTNTTFTCTTALTVTTLNTATATGTPPEGPVVEDTDSVQVAVTPVGINIEKLVNGQDIVQLHVGDTANYTFTVTLPDGDAPVSSVEVTDDKCTPISGPTGDTNSDGTLQSGETWVYTCARVIVAEDPDEIPNTATVNGVANTAPTIPVTDSDGAFVSVLRPAINVAKAADVSVVHSDDLVTYTYAVTNGGNTPLSNVALVDDACASVTGPTDGDTNGDGRLDLNETWLYSCSTTLADDTTNTATVTGEDDLGLEVQDTDTATVVVLNPSITLEKVADPTMVRLSDNEVQYTLTAFNDGDADLAGVTFTDDTCTGLAITGGDANGDGLMNPGETWTATCTARLDQDTTNNAGVTGTDALGEVASDTASADVIVINPSLDIVKTPSDSLIRAGDEVTYTYLVTNDGDDPLTNVSVADNVCSPVEPASVDLAVGASTTFTCTMNLPGTTTNAAIATGTASDGEPVNDSDVVTVTVANPAITIVKTADKAIVDPGGSVTYTYVVKNTGDVVLDPVTVEDDYCADVTPASLALDVGQEGTFTCTMTLTEDTINTAVATGQVPAEVGGDPATDTDTETVDVVPSDIVIAKSADQTVIHSGDIVTYTYLVTNPEEGALSIVTVEDDACSPVSYVSGDDGDGLLQNGETWTYTCAAQIATDTTNTAIAKGTTPGGGEVSDTDQAFVDVINPHVTLTKTVSPTVVRPGQAVTYTITIVNDGDVPLTIPAGGPVDDKCGELTVIEGGLQDNVLDVGETLVVQCSLIVTEGLTNIASVDGQDPLGGDVGDDDRATVDVQDPNLGITKAVDQDAVNAGDEVTYTIVVNNPSNSVLTEVVVSDDFCGPLTLVGGDDSDGVLDPGESWTYECTAVITEATTNTARVDATTFDDLPIFSEASADVRIKQVDVGVTKVTTTPILSVGDEAVFTIEATNLGPDPATGVQITDTMEPGLTFVSANPAAEFDADTGVWTVGDLAVGEVRTLEIRATVDVAAPVIGNTATRTATTEEDTNPDNDTSSAAVSQEATLELTKTASPSSLQVGQTTTFTITVTNSGPSTATGVEVLDVLPAGLQFVSASPSAGTFDSASGLWTVGNLEVDRSATLELVARATQAGTLTNVSTATSEQQDPDREVRAEATVTVTEPGAPPVTPPGGGSGGQPLPGTGAGGDESLLALLGLSWIFLGAGLVLISRTGRRAGR